MTDFAIILGLTFFVVCLAFVLFHSVRVGRLTLLGWSILGMGGVYGVGWSIVVEVTRSGGNPTWENWILPYTHLYPIHTALTFVLMAAMYFGWLIFGSLFLRGGRKTSLLGSKAINQEKRLLIAMWCLLITAFVMQWLYTLAYGGFLGLLEYSRSIRSAIFPIQNSLSFLQPFGGLALFASFGFFGLWLSRYRRPAVWLGLCLSSLFSLYILYSWMGRIGFLTYLATFVLGAILSRKPRPLSLLFWGLGIMIAILVGVYCISIWLNLKPADNLFLFLARELSFPFGSFFGQLDFGENLFRCFKDFIVAPVYLLPSSLWTQWVENVSQVNTALIMGAPKGEQGVTGAIPVDLLTLGLMQMSVFGIPIVGAAFGALLRLIQYLLDNVANPGLRAVFEAHIAIKIAVLGVFYAQPALFVSGNFALLVSVMVIIFFLKAPRILWKDTEQRVVLSRQ